MEVILLEDVADLGKKYDTVEVADGYGMNYLLPQKKARAATDRAKAQVKNKKEKLKQKRAEQKEAVRESLDQIKKEVITVERNANEDGQLFAGIDRSEIKELLTKKRDISLDTKYIMLEAPIKSVGEHEVAVAIDEDEAVFTLKVEEEE
jgi:large subunit ribosomal protein L9